VAFAFNRELNERQLRWALLLFFFALAIPAGLLIGRAYDQLKWEVFHQYRATAEQLTERIAHDIRRLIEVEEQRSFSEYDYSTASPDGAANFVQQSPLAAYPVVENIPGVVGYFQVDSQGRLSSPVALEGGDNDSEYGVGEDERFERIA
jgi:hypothetical protein